MLIYVDDVLLVYERKLDMDVVLTSLQKEFEVKDLGEANYILGIEIKRDTQCITISQQEYINQLTKRYNMEEAKVVSTPMEVGLKFDSQENQGATPHDIP